MLVLNENPRHPHLAPDGALAPQGADEWTHEPVGGLAILSRSSPPGPGFWVVRRERRKQARGPPASSDRPTAVQSRARAEQHPPSAVRADELPGYGGNATWR